MNNSIKSALKSLIEAAKPLEGEQGALVELAETTYTILVADRRGAEILLMLLELFDVEESLDALEQAQFWLKLLHNVSSTATGIEGSTVTYNGACPACNAPEKYFNPSLTAMGLSPDSDLSELEKTEIIYFCSNCDCIGSLLDIAKQKNNVMQWRG